MTAALRWSIPFFAALLLPVAASAQGVDSPAMPGFDVVSPKQPDAGTAPKAKPKAQPKPQPKPSADVDAGGAAVDGGAPDAGEAGAPSPDAGAADAGAPEAAPIVEAPTATAAAVRKGRVEGTVIDAKTGEPLIEAQVTVLETKKKVLTDIDGNYQVSLPPGTYNLRVWAELKAGRRISSVVVEKGKTTRIDVSLGEDTKAVMQELVVVAKPDTATEAVQLVRRQKSAAVSDAISAEQLSRTPDANASEAVKRVVGATIQDNKYVVIRGLAGRYSLTLLNGVPLPSPDPDLPSAPLDLFPAALLANLTVVKTFSPDLPGWWAGGVLLIETRDYPSHFTLKLRLGTAVDSTATFREVNTYKGGSLDFLGYDDGTRDLPSAIPRDRPAKGFDYATRPLFTPEELATMGRAFKNNWDLYKHRALPALGLGATIGDTVTVGGRKLGYLASVLYGNRWTRQQAHIASVGARNPDGSYRPGDAQLDADTGVQTVALGGLLNVGYTISPTHRLALISMYSHNTENAATEVTGQEANGNIVNRLRFRFLQRTMQFNQIAGEHAFLSGRLIWNWQGHLAFVSQLEPDTRDLYRSLIPSLGTYAIGTGSGAAERTFGDAHETTGGAGTDFIVPFRVIKLKAGGTFFHSPRTSSVRRFHFEFRDDPLRLLGSQAAFAPDNIRPGGIEFDERTTKDDAYDATRTVYNAYLMADLVRLEPFRVIGGARFDLAETDLTVGKGLGVNPDAIMRINRRDRAVLPAINTVYALSGRSNLRAAYGGTVVRPHLRELSPSQFYDYVRNRAVAGNPYLSQTYVHNADLRWELFPSGAEVLAASGFYKYFEHPIERVIAGAGDVNFENADNAHAAGIELEARFNGGRIRPRLEPLYLGANFTYTYSRVKETAMDGQVTYRALQGQSPYVVNAEIGYRRGGTQLSLLYNVFGRRIAEVGTGGAGDVYEEAFNRLDITLNQRLPRGLTFKVSGTNLLNQRIVFRQGDKADSGGGPAIYAYRPGVVGLAVLEWSYEGANK